MLQRYRGVRVGVRVAWFTYVSNYRSDTLRNALGGLLRNYLDWKSRYMRGFNKCICPSFLFWNEKLYWRTRLILLLLVFVVLRSKPVAHLFNPTHANCHVTFLSTDSHQQSWRENTPRYSSMKFISKPMKITSEYRRSCSIYLSIVCCFLLSLWWWRELRGMHENWKWSQARLRI